MVGSDVLRVDVDVGLAYANICCFWSNDDVFN
jgi:hypothetical protein